MGSADVWSRAADWLETTTRRLGDIEIEPHAVVTALRAVGCLTLATRMALLRRAQWLSWTDTVKRPVADVIKAMRAEAERRRMQ